MVRIDFISSAWCGDHFEPVLTHSQYRQRSKAATEAALAELKRHDHVIKRSLKSFPAAPSSTSLLLACAAVCALAIGCVYLASDQARPSRLQPRLTYTYMHGSRRLAVCRKRQSSGSAGSLWQDVTIACRAA
jgi:hypothetical protein